MPVNTIRFAARAYIMKVLSPLKGTRIPNFEPQMATIIFMGQSKGNTKNVRR